MKATQATQARAGADERQEAQGTAGARPRRRAEVRWAPRSLLGFESLAMSSPGDASEVEADAAAQRLVRGLPAHVSPPSRPAVQRRASGIPSAFLGVPFAPSDVGSPLPGGVRSTFGRLLGHDLGGVRVHTGADAARSADHLNADAYTVGDDVVFADGRYAPETPLGRELLAHELAHVAQQRGGERRVQRHGRSSRTTSSSSATHLPHGTTPSVARGLRILGQTRLDALDAALNADRTHPTHLTATARARPGATLLDLVGEVWFATRRHLVRMDRRGRLEEQDWLYEVSGSSLEPGGTYIFAEVQLTKGSQSTVRHLVRVDGVGGLSDHEVGTRMTLGSFLPLQQHGAAALARGRILAVIAPDQDSALESPTFSPSQARAALRRAQDLVPDERAHVARRIREDLLGFTTEQVLGFAQGALMGVVGSLGLAMMGTQILHDVLPMLELAGNAVSPADEVEFAGRGLARYFVETTISLLGGFAIGGGIRLARGLRSGGLRAWMRERLRALREPGQEAAGLAGLEARPARPALLRVLGELAAHFEVVENPQLRGDAARVVYDTPSGRPRLEVGPDASEFMVGRHRGVMRVVLRFYARFGLARRVMSRLGQLLGLGPGFGSNGWEARLEVVKLTQILALLEPIYAQLAAQEAGMAPGRARPQVSEALMRQIVELRQQLAENELRVDSTSRGRGYIAVDPPGGAGRPRQISPGPLRVHEGESTTTNVEGHTLGMHIEKSAEQLAARLRDNEALDTAGSFASSAQAQEAVDALFQLHQQTIRDWLDWWHAHLTSPTLGLPEPPQGLPLEANSARLRGLGVDMYDSVSVQRSATGYRAMSVDGARAVLVIGPTPSAYAPVQSFTIQTAYPLPGTTPGAPVVPAPRTGTPRRGRR